MMWWLIGGGILLYIVGCYVVVGRWLSKEPGPYGFGLLVIPFAPLLLPMAIWIGVKSLMRKVFS